MSDGQLERFYDIVSAHPGATAYWIGYLAVIVGACLFALVEFKHSIERRDDAAAERREVAREHAEELHQGWRAAAQFRRDYTFGRDQHPTHIRDALRRERRRNQQKGRTA